MSFPRRKPSALMEIMLMGMILGGRPPSNPVPAPEPSPEDIARKTRIDQERIAAAQAKRERKALRKSNP